MTAAGSALDQVIAAHREHWALPGVLSVRPGWEFTGGWPVDPPVAAVVVTVAHKTSSPPGGRLLPDTVGGVPVDVREASPRKLAALAGTDGWAPLPDADAGGGTVPQFAGEVRPGGSALAPVAAVSKPRLPYTGPDGVPLEPVTGVATVQAAASPDAGWPVLAAFLGAVQDTLTIGLYDWTSAHVLQTFVADLAGRTVDLVLDHPSRNPTADQTDEQTVTALRAAFGADLTQAWALEASDPLASAWQFTSAYHIKVAVADHRRVWLSSGNWNNSNQPDIDPVTVPADAEAARSGDRDWHVVIDSEPLAGVFEAYLRHDLEVASQHQRPPAAAADDLDRQAALTAPVVVPGAQTPPFARFFAPTSVTGPVTITPVLTPDVGSYAPHGQALIASATTRLYLQFQYIELPRDPSTADPAFTALIAAVVERQDAGVDVRIVMSEFEVQGYLEQLMTAGLHVATTVRIQNNVHNKGIVVDGRTVLVSSQNWSNAGTTTNRDAGVIVDDPTIAGYFETIFLHDWENLAATSAAED